MVDLNKIVSQLKSGKGGYKDISIAGESEDKFEFVSTGNLAFDLIADGGVPFGYCVEFIGESSSGKSLFIYKVIAGAQDKYNAVAVLIDREKAYTRVRGNQLGIDNNNLVICPPKQTVLIPDAFRFMIDFIQKVRKADEVSGETTYIVLALDSVGAFDQDTALEKSSTPRRAKDLHIAFRKIMPYIDDNIMFLASNHKTYKVGVLFGDPSTTTGGEAVKYYNNVRFALEDRKKIIDENKEVVGNWIGIEVIKTRLGPCYRTCYVKHFYETGIDYYSGYARLLAERGYLKPKNKSEFNSFKQSTLVYTEKEINENRIEEVLEDYPELKFDKFPEFKKEEKDEIPGN